MNISTDFHAWNPTIVEKNQREYLHQNLSKKKMHDMFLEEHAPRGISESYTTYCEVIKTQIISFHNPKKDLCKL